jgi:hypothetical protein
MSYPDHFMVDLMEAICVLRHPTDATTSGTWKRVYTITRDGEIKVTDTRRTITHTYMSKDEARDDIAAYEAEGWVELDPALTYSEEVDKGVHDYEAEAIQNHWQVA